MENDFFMIEPDYDNTKITIVGLGYVGLPLAVEFGKKYFTIGMDINQSRIEELKQGIDKTLELDSEQIRLAKHLTFSNNFFLEDDSRINVYIVTVPTPIDKFKIPDLIPLLSATRAIGRVLKKNDIVIYESTVYPGCTEEDCVPILEMESNLIFNKDFFCGYSPERINPGDKFHTVTQIKKVTSGSNLYIADFVDKLYRTVITAGTYRAQSIKVAEAAKVIENCQRDINIAFVNELALIFNKMDIDTNSVLEAAGSKWNFLKFSPGLVGGHCIGVDPYYLTYKAESIGYLPQVILAGRRINDNMGKYVAGQFIKLLVNQGTLIKDAPVLVLGITFKENCPDIRNSRVIDIINELREYKLDVDIFDNWADGNEVKEEYDLDLLKNINFEKYKGIILAVAHNDFRNIEFSTKMSLFTGVVYDVKGILDSGITTQRL